MKKLILALILLCLTACENTISPIAPSPITTEPSPGSVPVVEPSVRVDTYANVADLRIASSFALGEQTDAFIKEWIENLLRNGYNCSRVCGETLQWGFAPHIPQGSKGIDGVKNLLRISAEYPGFYILLVPICTIRDTGTFAQMREYTERVAHVVMEEDYKHVVFEAVNEHWHPASHIRKDSQVKQLVRILQRTGLPVGTDDNVHRGSYVYNSALRGIVDFISVHPFRNPDPSRAEISRIIRKNGGLVVLSETTAYVKDSELPWFRLPNGNLAGRGETTTAKRKAQIRAYKENCDSVPGCVWTYHSVTGLGCTEQLDWIP